MTQKYYAVTGTVNSGIYENLRDVQKQTMNTRNGEYRVFETLEEAHDYLVWSEEHEGTEYVHNEPVEEVPDTEVDKKKDKFPIGVTGFKYAQKERKPKRSKYKCEEDKLVKQNKANEEANAKRYEELKRSQVKKSYYLRKKHKKRNKYRKSKSQRDYRKKA